MSLRLLPLLIVCLTVLLLPQVMHADHRPLLRENATLHLLQQPGLEGEIEPEPGLHNFFDYFNAWWPIVLGSAVGMAVLHGVVGGIQIMIGGSPEKAAEGKERIMWSLAGMVIIVLAGLILTSLNSVFFT